jgi:hypothetical protein
MRLFTFLILCCSVVFAADLWAEQPIETTSTTTAQNDPPQVKAGPLKTLVVRIEARRKVDPELALALETVVQSTLTQDESRLVFGQEDLKRIFEFEGERQALGCTDTDCLAEFANALDADRLVMGTMDKMGKSYLLVLIEIDGKTLRPVGRVQKVISSKEDVLVTGVERLTLELLAQNEKSEIGQDSDVNTASVAGKNGKGSKNIGKKNNAFAFAGSVEVSSVPQGATVMIDGEEMGKTPVVLHNLAVGDVKIKIKRKAYQNVLFEVPVFKSKKTKVKAELFLSTKPAKKHHASKMRIYEGQKKSNLWWGLTKLGCSGVLCMGSLSMMGLAISSEEQDIGDPGAGWATSFLSGVTGAGFAWAGFSDLFKHVPRPKGDWELNRQIRINPPKGKGKLILFKTKDALVNK